MPSATACVLDDPYYHHHRTRFTNGELAPLGQAPLTLGALSIDYTQHAVAMAGRKVILTPTEYRLLAYLSRNADQVVPQERLLENAWGSAYVGENHLLQVNINRLRRKLEDDPAHPRYLLSEPGVGYVLAAPKPAQAEPEPAEGREP